MHLDDQEETSFMAEIKIYCYKVMSTGLKDSGLHINALSIRSTSRLERE